MCARISCLVAVDDYARIRVGDCDRTVASHRVAIACCHVAYSIRAWIGMCTDLGSGLADTSCLIAKMNVAEINVVDTLRVIRARITIFAMCHVGNDIVLAVVAAIWIAPIIRARVLVVASALVRTASWCALVDSAWVIIAKVILLTPCQRVAAIRVT